MKLLVFDVEGTIFEAKYKIEGTDYSSTLWQPIAHSLGEAAEQEEKETHIKWENKEYSNYMEWVKASILIHKKYGLKEEVFNGLVREAKYNKGVIPFFENLNRKKYIPVIISGGFQNLNNRAQSELRIYHSYSACKYLFDKDGFLESWNVYPSDFEDKYDHVKLLFKQYSLNSNTDWVFVGDGRNDVDIARRAPLSIAFGDDAHQQLIAICQYHINDFLELNSILSEFENGQAIVKKSNIDKITLNVTKEISIDSREIDELKRENKKLKQDKNDLLGKVKGIENKIKNNVDVFETDYTNTPNVKLEEFLEKYRIAFIGMKDYQSSFMDLDNLHKNLIVIAGDKNTFNTSKISNCEFIFYFVGSSSHSVNYKINKFLRKKPYAFLWLDNRNLTRLQNAMGNVLNRYFFNKDMNA